MKLMIRITAIGPSGSGKTEAILKLEKILEAEGFVMGATLREMNDFFYESSRSSEERYYKKEESKEQPEEPNYRLGVPEL